MALGKQDIGEDATVEEFKRFAKQVLTYSTNKYQNIQDLYRQQIEWLDKIRDIHGQKTNEYVQEYKPNLQSLKQEQKTLLSEVLANTQAIQQQQDRIQAKLQKLRKSQIMVQNQSRESQQALNIYRKMKIEVKS